MRDRAVVITEPIGSKVSLLRFDLPGTGHVLFTTRTHGNMSSVGGLDHEHGHHARDRLHAAGVHDVQDVAACTICDEHFFSYRREHTRAGRQAGVAWLS